MSDRPRDKERDTSALDDVDEEDVEHLEDNVDTAALDDDELVSLDDAARALLAKPRRGHGPVSRLYRGETRFDFVGRRRIWFCVSAGVIALGILSIVVRGGLNLGIEFKGGTEWTIAAPGVTQTQAADAIKGTGVINPTVELLGSGGKQTLTIQSDLNRLSQAQQDAVNKSVQKALLGLTSAHSTTSTSSGDKVSITNVGPTWGSSITDKAIQALIIFFVVVAIYISIRFEPKMALAAFIAMVHDVLVAVGIYSIFNFQVTPDTVVAILTILGYSLYDTVVVFDRVRDNTRGIGSSGRLTYPQLINLSMNQTLARSINTSMVAILPVLAVLLIGAQLLGATTLQSYGLALFVGLVSGAYSSIFIAAPVLCMMKEREDRWITIANRLAKRGDTANWYSAADAAAMNTQMSVAASGQQPRAGVSVPKSRRGGVIRPGSGSGSGTGGTGSGSGGGTAVMDPPRGGSAVPDDPAVGTGPRAGPGQIRPGSRAGQAARPRKHRGKRRR